MCEGKREEIDLCTSDELRLEGGRELGEQENGTMIKQDKDLWKKVRSTFPSSRIFKFLQFIIIDIYVINNGEIR